MVDSSSDLDTTNASSRCAGGVSALLAAGRHDPPGRPARKNNGRRLWCGEEGLDVHV